MQRKKFITIMLAAASALVLIIAVPMTISAVRGPEVEAVKAQKRELIQTVVATGRVISPARIRLGATLLATVAAVTPDEGQAVEKGTVLIQLDDQEQQAALQGAMAGVKQARIELENLRQIKSPAAAESLKQAETRLRQARENYERSHSLLKSGVITQVQYDKAAAELELALSARDRAALDSVNLKSTGSAYRLALARLSQAEAALAQARVRLDQTRLRAPTDAIVLKRSVEPGDVVQPGAVLMVLARSGKSQLMVPIDERNLRGLAVGQKAIASADAYPETTFEASISEIAPLIDARRGTVDVKLVTTEAPKFLRDDMTVSVEIELGRRAQATVVPARAVQSRRNAPFVYSLDDNRVIKRDVDIGLQSADSVEIRSGLKPADIVLIPQDGELTVGRPARPQFGQEDS